MKTNTEILMNSVGWQGGTVFALSKHIGLSVQDILDLHKHKPSKEYDKRDEWYEILIKVRKADQAFESLK